MTLVIFLYIYYAFLFVWGLIALVALYHILSYGVRGLVTVFATLVFVGVSGLILSSSFFYIQQIDWTVSVPMLNVDLDFDNELNF